MTVSLYAESPVQMTVLQPEIVVVDPEQLKEELHVTVPPGNGVIDPFLFTVHDAAVI
jgi:hypothetical protein